MKYILIGFLVYVAIVFVIRIVIPVYIASRKIKKGFREMQDRVRQQQGGQQDPFQRPPEPKPAESSKGKAGDYIEFEENR